MSKKHEAQMRKIEEKMSLENRECDLNRARSITVGTCFGGTTELMVRGNDGRVLWLPMQPVETIELIHQLAANVGCHIHLKPRDDFSSWREWRVSEAEKKHLNGHPPFVSDMAHVMQLGRVDFDQEKAESVVNETLAQKEYVYVNGAATRAPRKEQKNAVATKKTVNGRSTKRATKTS